MPFLNLPEDGVELHYLTNLPPDTPPPPNHETILLLAGTLHDSSSLLPLFSHPLLEEGYTLFAVDIRSRGPTRNAPHPAHDACVDAADCAKFIEKMVGGNREGVHVFAVSTASVSIAQTLAILWPEKVLSLTLIGIRGPSDPPWVLEAMGELCQTYISAPDLETMEEIMNECFAFAYGEWLTEEQKDIVAAYYETHYPPTRACRFYDSANPYVDREPLTEEMLAAIRCPVLIINGDATSLSSAQSATELCDSLINVPGGAHLHIIPGAPDEMHYIEAFEGMVVGYFEGFLDSLPPAPPPPPHIPPLERLAALMHDPSIGKRDPALSISFSIVPLAAQEVRRQTLAQLAEVEKAAFSPFGRNGSPPRKFSERMLVETHLECCDWAAGVEVEDDEEEEILGKEICIEKIEHHVVIRHGQEAGVEMALEDGGNGHVLTGNHAVTVMVQ